MVQIQAKQKFCINGQKFALTATPVEFLSGKAEHMILHILSRPELMELHWEASRAAYKPVLCAVPWTYAVSLSDIISHSAKSTMQKRAIDV